MGDDLAFELRRSSSPAHMEDYRQKDLVSDTQIPVCGQEPVQAISYRPIAPLDQISGLVPTYGMTTATSSGHPTTVSTTTSTSAGYVNGGQSINFRPKQTEPFDRSGGLGVGEVDFDTKCTDAYANLDDVRADRDYLRANEAIYKGVPNRSKGNKKAQVSCVFASFVIFIFILEVVILVLGVFNLVNGLEVGSLTKGLVAPSSTGSTPSPTTTPSVPDLSVKVKELRKEVDDLMRNLSEYNATHISNITTISSKLLNLNGKVANLSTGTSTPGLPGTNASVSFNQGCTTQRRECLTTYTDPDDSNSNLPRFASCATPKYRHNDTDSSIYLADVFCSVDTDSQVMPIASTLSLTGEGYSCLCHGIQIPSTIQALLRNFNCYLHFTVCPSAIPVAVPPQ